MGLEWRKLSGTFSTRGNTRSELRTLTESELPFQRPTRLEARAAEDNLERGGETGRQRYLVVRHVAGLHTNLLFVFFVAEDGHLLRLDSARIPDHRRGGSGLLDADAP